MTVHTERRGRVTVVTIDRPEVRNAVDAPTADALVAAFTAFDADEESDVAILTGANGVFCAGADLKAFAGGGERASRVDKDMSVPGPMGPSRMLLGKPVIAAVEGFAVAGGLELAIWCDLRVAATDAVFGVFCRRWGVPLIDGGTVRLPRLIGHSHALDLILTGRGVSGDEAQRMGLANRLCEPGQALATALELAEQLTTVPQSCMRSDRLSSYDQWDLGLVDALARELDHGLVPLREGVSRDGAARFAGGAGRHGVPNHA
jgi:enoyl-CoA hydratase